MKKWNSGYLHRVNRIFNVKSIGFIGSSVPWWRATESHRCSSIFDSNDDHPDTGNRSTWYFGAAQWGHSDRAWRTCRGDKRQRCELEQSKRPIQLQSKQRLVQHTSQSKWIVTLDLKQSTDLLLSVSSFTRRKNTLFKHGKPLSFETVFNLLSRPLGFDHSNLTSSFKDVRLDLPGKPAWSAWLWRTACTDHWPIRAFEFVAHEKIWCLAEPPVCFNSSINSMPLKSSGRSEV